jgi:hypothetical protein
MNQIKKKTPNKPFFTRFLDHQALKQTTAGGGPVVTDKYPSDSDEHADDK